MAEITIIEPFGCDDDDDEHCKRGKRGHRGRRGHEGRAINLLKFSGLAVVASEVLSTTALADTGLFAGVAPLTSPPHYPAPVTYEIGSFAANILTVVPILSGSVQFQILKNGVQVGTPITYTPSVTSPPGVKTVTFPAVTFNVGDTIDVVVVATPAAADVALLYVSAMVGP